MTPQSKGSRGDMMAKKGHKRESTSGEIEEYLANLATVLCDNCVPLPGQSDNCVVHTEPVDKFLLSPTCLPLLVDIQKIDRDGHKENISSLLFR